MSFSKKLLSGYRFDLLYIISNLWFSFEIMDIHGTMCHKLDNGISSKSLSLLLFLFVIPSDFVHMIRTNF